MSSTYSFSVIHQDLRQEETIVQIAYALDLLSSSVNDTFQKIEERINENKKKLEKIKGRSMVVRTKIERLSGSNKSTKIFSSAKYPVSTDYESYSGLFVYENGPLKVPGFSYRINSKHQPLESKTLVEKLQFYHVKLGTKNHKKNLEVTPEEGLGCLPWDLVSVTSLLLFNTSENPYQRYVQLDPLGAISRTRQALLEERAALEAPPLSISQRDQPERPLVDSYFYSPGLGDVPLMDVPLDLPDLPGVADDLRYSVDMGPIIAPSVSTTPSLPDLPVVSENPSNPSETKLLQTLSVSPYVLALPSPPTQPSLPLLENQQQSSLAPPLPPALSLPVDEPLSPPAPPVPPPPSPPPPPPPLPPLPSRSQDTETAPVVTLDKPQATKPLQGDMRANLMEAIRQAGGSGKANLRSAKHMKLETRKRMQEEKASSTDLMADLHAKLALRRKGISGAKKTDGSVGGAMLRVSAMIPPPQSSESDSNFKEDGEDVMDEDWD